MGFVRTLLNRRPKTYPLIAKRVVFDGRWKYTLEVKTKISKDWRPVASAFDKSVWDWIPVPYMPATTFPRAFAPDPGKDILYALGWWMMGGRIPCHLDVITVTDAKGKKPQKIWIDVCDDCGDKDIIADAVASYLYPDGGRISKERRRYLEDSEYRFEISDKQRYIQAETNGYITRMYF